MMLLSLCIAYISLWWYNAGIMTISSTSSYWWLLSSVGKTSTTLYIAIKMHISRRDHHIRYSMVLRQVSIVLWTSPRQDRKVESFYVVFPYTPPTCFCYPSFPLPDKHTMYFHVLSVPHHQPCMLCYTKSWEQTHIRGIFLFSIPLKTRKLHVVLIGPCFLNNWDYLGGPILITGALKRWELSSADTRTVREEQLRDSHHEKDLAIAVFPMEGTIEKEARNLQKLRENHNWQPAREWGLQSYNCKEMNVTNYLNETGSKRSARTSREQLNPADTWISVLWDSEEPVAPCWTRDLQN